MGLCGDTNFDEYVRMDSCVSLCLEAERACSFPFCVSSFAFFFNRLLCRSVGLRRSVVTSAVSDGIALYLKKQMREHFNSDTRKLPKTYLDIKRIS